MTQEEIKQFIESTSKDILDNNIRDLVNSAMDFYQKGVEVGIKIGSRLQSDRVLTWFSRKIDPQNNGRSQVVLFYDSVEELKKILES